MSDLPTGSKVIIDLPSSIASTTGIIPCTLVSGFSTSGSLTCNSTGSKITVTGGFTSPQVGTGTHKLTITSLINPRSLDPPSSF